MEHVHHLQNYSEDVLNGLLDLAVDLETMYIYARKEIDELTKDLYTVVCKVRIFFLIYIVLKSQCM